MNLVNCQRCGKMFVKIKSPVCPDCQRAEEELFDKVVAFLKENVGATVAEVATALECDVEIIDKFIRNGRLGKVNPVWQPKCKRCGILINSGELCEQCRLQLANEFSNTLPRKNESNEKARTASKSKQIYLIDRVKNK